MFKTPPPGVVTRSKHKLHAAEVASEPIYRPLNVPNHELHGAKSQGNPSVKSEMPQKPKYSPCATVKSTDARSKKSMSSSLARRKQLELEAAQAKAAIQIQLIDKQLEANLANLEAEEHADDVTERSQSINGGPAEALNNVEVWLENSQVKPCAATEPPVRNPPPLSTTCQQRHRDEPTSDVKQLALVLKEMMSQTHSQQENRLLNRLAAPRDLPSFSGDYVEWLHYKSAYNESTQICKFSDTENLWRLRRSLRGEAREAVTDLLIGNTPPSSIMHTLELRYGRPDIIITKITSQLKKLPSLPQYYQSSLIDFSTKINNYVATIRALEKPDYLRCPELMNAIILKLPSSLLSKWTDYAYTRNLSEIPKLELLADFLKYESEILLTVGAIVPHDTHTYKRTFDNYNKQQSESKTRERHNLFTTTAHDDKERCKFCKKAVHMLSDCRMFRRALRNDRWRFVKSHRLCFGCLLPRHEGIECSVPVCDIDNCGLPHNRLLHYNKPVQQTVAAIDLFTPSAPPPLPPPRPASTTPRAPAPTAQPRHLKQPSSSSSVSTVAHVGHVSTSDNEYSSNVSGQVLLKVVQVKLRGPKGSEVITYALLDDGASVSIIDSELADQLGLVSKESCAVKFIDAFGIEILQSDTPKVILDISSMDDDCKYKIQLRKVSKFNLPTQNMSVINNLQCKHLLHLKDLVCKGFVKPRLIIGEDNYHLLAPLQIIHGNKNEPYATKCRLGWCIHGCSGRIHLHAEHNVFHLTCSEPTDNDMYELNNLIKDSFAIDSIGISPSRRENTAHVRALNILDSSIRNVNNQWEVGLPFKNDTFVMPDSYDNALSRMRSLSRKFSKDKEYAERYRKEMEKLFTEGYAREVTDSDKSPSHVWYLPHFGVQNPNKPGKLRLVFDAAAKAALCADYSVPVDCVSTGPAPRPSSFHEISAPKVEFIEAYCTPRDTARRSPQRNRRSREPRRSPEASRWRYDSRRTNYDFDSNRRPYDYEGRRNREFDGDSGRRPEFDAESARRRADYESARRTDFDLSAPGASRRSPESAPEGSVESPPEPAPSAPLRHNRQTRHPRSQPYYESESSSEDRSSTSEEEEDEFGEFDPFATAPSLHSPDSGRSDPRYANAPRRNPSPYYYGDLFKTAPTPPAPSAPTASTTSSSRGPRYRKSASLDAPHVAQRPNLPKRFSVAEDGFRELERSSSSSGESAWMPPRRRGRDAAGCACAAPEDVEDRHPSRSVFYVPAPLPRWSQEMTTRQIYETAFDCKITRSDDDLDDFDRVSNHPALLQAEERKVISSASSAFEAVERSEPDFKGRRKVTMKTDSVRRSKIPTIRQKRENENNACALSEELEKVHIEEEERTASISQLPLRGYTPSPPSTAPLPTKFQQKDGSAMNSIKSAPNLPQTQPAHPRLKDLRLPVKSLRARETPTSSEASMADAKGSTDLDLAHRLRDGDDDRGQSKDGIFLEIKGRPTSDSDTPEMNRYTGPKGVGPIMEFKGRPCVTRPRRKYSSTESMATSSSGGSMESLRSSNSEGDRSSSSSESRHSSSLSSHSSDSGNVPFTKSHHMQLSGFGHHPTKLHILSPISDKSSQEPASETSDNNKNNNSQKVSPEDCETGNTTIQTTVEIVAKPKRRALQNRNLLNLTFRHSTAGDAEIQGSDSGISIHSREGVDSRNAFINFKNNTEEENKVDDVDLSDLPFDMPKLRRRRAEAEADLRSLPFDMPKLRRKLRGQSLQLNSDFGGAISNASSSQSVQDLNQENKHKPNLKLNFDSGSGGSSSSKGLHLNLGPIAPPRDLVDATLPLDRQGWYHGTLTRVEAESLLREADEGAFLVRNSESAKHDYSLSLKSTRGFMHMRICRGTDGYTLGGATTAFPTVPALMRHYVTAQRLPVRGAEHMALSTPLPAVLL